MKNSIIINFIKKLFNRLSYYHKCSVLYQIQKSSGAIFIRWATRSYILRLFIKDWKIEEVWTSSIVYRFLMLPLELLRVLTSRMKESLNSTIKYSMLLKIITQCFECFLLFSTKVYGLCLLAFALTDGILKIVTEGYVARLLNIEIVLVSVMLILIDRSIKTLGEGSFILKLATDFFISGGKSNKAQPSLTNKKIDVAALVIGTLLGVLVFFMTFRIFILAIGGILIVMLVLWKYEIGVFFSVALIPLSPTIPLLGLVLLTIVSFVIRQFISSNFRFSVTPIDPFIVFFIGVMLFSSLTSYTQQSSLMTLAINVIIIAFYFVLINTITTKQRLYNAVAFLLLTSAVAAAYGIYQYYMGDLTADAWVDATLFEDIKTRVVSTFGNPNILGEYLILIIPLSIALLWEQKNWLVKLSVMGLTAIMIMCLVYTSSRGAWLGFVLAISMFTVLRDKRLLILYLIGLFFIPFILPTSIINRFTSIGNLQDSSLAYRLSIMLGSLKMVKDYWPSGIGLGIEPFKLIYPQYSFSAAYAQHSHSFYIELLLETGIVGFLVFMGMLLVFFKSILSHYFRVKDRFISTFMLMSGISLIGYLIHGIAEYIWYNNRVLLTFWVVIALGMAAYKLTVGDNEVEMNG
ncbi:O-antigen ligase family protein [Lutispora sp.]|uniref:O-antigen ligase family protein n=1 Tax=Lutispora sp. TaxID=2828727 RepID=UPI003566905C